MKFNIKDAIQSICRKYGLPEVEMVIRETDGYTAFESTLIIFKNGKEKRIHFDDINYMRTIKEEIDLIKNELIKDLPYMDRKMRGLA